MVALSIATFATFATLQFTIFGMLSGLSDVRDVSLEDDLTITSVIQDLGNVGASKKVELGNQAREVLREFEREEEFARGAGTPTSFANPTGPKRRFTQSTQLTDELARDSRLAARRPVERRQVNGPECNRDCTTNQDFRECVWNFVVKNQYSDAPGRFIDGRKRGVLTYNGQITGPSITVCELDTVVINLKNEIQGTFEERQGHSNGTTLHMHGIRQWGQPYEDGVPGVTQCEIKSGETFQYIMNADDDHENAPPGTYWYHSHVGSQRTNGLYGALIIKPRCMGSYECNNTLVDDAKYTLVLQEWYINETVNIPISILINGNGRVGQKMNAIPKDVDNWDVYLDKFNRGENVSFDQVDNPDYPNYRTNYAEFDVDYGTCYRFRIIGAISQNFPLCVSIEDHKFTAIATDSIDFQPEADMDAVCLSAGERYDIVVKTKTKTEITNHRNPYMIKVYGQSNDDSPLCTLAWLKYPGQRVNYRYFIDKTTCQGFKPVPSQKVLNPVMGPNFVTTSNDITVNLLTAIEPPNGITNSLNRNYVEFTGLKFNDFSMTYNDVPFLFQSPADTTNRCGPVCNNDPLNLANDVCNPPSVSASTCPRHQDGSFVSACQCEHVVHQPHIPSYWFETILINPYDGHMTAAHPIHKHGGWYRVLAIEQFPTTEVISKEKIMNKDTDCPARRNCLPRNYGYPIQKDTIQVPVNGYVIFRTTLDNAGAWIVHCHINHHVESGMAMVFQIGGLDDIPIPFQAWSLGPFKEEVNQLTCPLNTYQNPASLNWFYGMKPIEACCDPGNTITFTWLTGHNVIQVDNNVYETCTGFLPGETTAYTGDWTWTCPPAALTTPYYFACGVGDGYHCLHGGLKAKVTVPC